MKRQLISETQALTIAKIAHRGQKYGDEDYILHVVDVARRVRKDPSLGPGAVVVALLHDVVEDTGVTLNDLVSLGISAEQVLQLDALTRRKGEEYEAYIERVSGNPVAAIIKLHDLQSNIEAGPEHPNIEKYQNARLALLKAIKPQTDGVSNDGRRPSDNG